MSQAWAAYRSALARRPLLVNMCTSCVAWTAGDVLAQKCVSSERVPYDPVRTLRMASFGFLLHGSMGNMFYRFLDRAVLGRSVGSIAAKVAIDQLCWNPVFGCTFFTYMGVAEGKSINDIGTTIESDLKTSVVGSWACWIPAHAVNFALVPPQLRMLYISSVQIGYNVFLSCLANKGTEDVMITDSTVNVMPDFNCGFEYLSQHLSLRPLYLRSLEVPIFGVLRDSMAVNARGLAFCEVPDND